MNGYLFFIGLSAAIAIPNFVRARTRSQIVACMEQMSNMAAVAQDRLTENGTLVNVENYEELCGHMFAGVEDPSQCAAQLRDRANRVCESGTVKFTARDDFSYVIEGHARDKNHCLICITESETLPEIEDIPDNCPTVCPE